MAQRKLLIDDFLYPALETRKYGELLCWVKREEGIFKVYFGHKNASDWEPRTAVLFQDWDRTKGRLNPGAKNYYPSAKQRFRSAMYRLPSVQQLPCSEKHFRIYQLISAGRRSQKMDESKANSPDGGHLTATPTPVLHEPTEEMTTTTGPIYTEDMFQKNMSEPVPVCQRYSSFPALHALLHNCSEERLSEICSVAKNVPQIKHQEFSK